MKRRAAWDPRRGSTEWTHTPTTDEYGMVSWTVTASMQPGNNYRAGASCLEDALDQAGQAGADALSSTYIGLCDPYTENGDFEGYEVPLVWSEMLTVWRKLHVETDSMVRPTFAQNTFTMGWNQPAQGSAPTQVVFDVDDPPADGAQTDHQQFTYGYVELADVAGIPIVSARVVDYVTEGCPSEAMDDDEATVNIPDCGGGQSGLACLGGVTSGTAVFSDDDLSDQPTFTAKVWGCDDVYAGGGTALAAPDLSALEMRYKPAYIEPVHEAAQSATGGITTFLRNIDFDDNDGKVLWDQILPIRGLPVSTPGYWSAMVVSAFQPEWPEDKDPDTEAGDGSGITLGICTHKEYFGAWVESSSWLGSSYTGISAVCRAVVGEIDGRERYTVAHEVAHTLGVDHDTGLMCRHGDCQTEPFSAQSLKELREYVQP